MQSFTLNKIKVGVTEILGGGGGVVKKRQSPDFRSPEVGISAFSLASIHDCKMAHYMYK